MVYRFKSNGTSFEPVGQFNNNTWGLGFNENFEIFGSTANNNHCCYVGIPLKHYDYLGKKPAWALNSDFIQGHYEIKTIDSIPFQQVDVRGGYTAAAGANFYTARNYPKSYQNQMYVNEPTGHLVHLSKIVRDGAGYKEVDGGNIFASTDAWTAPVFTETGPDGNLWVADWYNPVIQHNPDKRGMDNQIWNANKGEGNAHLNEHRDKRHGRIYILKHEDGHDSDITALDVTDDKGLLNGLQSDNLFWRITAQRLIVEGNKEALIPQLIALFKENNKVDESGLSATALHVLWTLNGLGAIRGNEAAKAIVFEALNHPSFAVKKAAIALLPKSIEGSNALANSGLINNSDLAIRLDAILRASELPETSALFEQIEVVANDTVNTSDKWIQAAINVYHQVPNYKEVDSENVKMLLPTADDGKTNWRYIQEAPSENWSNIAFDDSSWRKGQAIFGGEEMDNEKTIWSTSDIWLRREFNLNEKILEPVLKIMHDDDYEIYINGQLFLAEEGVSADYKYIKLDESKGSLFKKGKNVIAVHCHDDGGDRFIDVGIGVEMAPKADVVFNLKTVNQKMAFDKTVLRATAGQTAEIVLENTDQMPHNLVVINEGSLEAFGEMVDVFLKNPDADKMNYVPNSRYVLAATKMLEPGNKESILFQLPEKPGRYPFVCTFPGHWRIMQGVIIVNAPGTYISEDADAPKIAMMGGGGSHNFVKYFGEVDGKILSEQGRTSILYTEDSRQLGELIKESDALFICNNKPIDEDTRKTIFKRVDEGMNMLIYHPSTWYNWKDWPEYNKELVGGGSRSHEKLQEFEVRVIKPNHPIMKGVPSKFRIIDELYRWEADPEAVGVEVLAVGRGLKSGEEFPVVWVVKHAKSKIIGNTLGHDERAHSLAAYKTILQNSSKWIK